MAMRQSYWNDVQSPKVIQEKEYFQQILIEQGIFQTATIEDAKQLFFSLPSIIIVKGYASGFLNHAVQHLISQHIQENKALLQQKTAMKIKFRL